MPRIAVIADFLEERWPSMDLAAEQLASHLSALEGIEAELVRRPLRTTFRTRPNGLARALGRFAQLPIELAPQRFATDYFHIADHSYAHLALLYPRDRVGVYCHDIDAFRALLPNSGAARTRRLLSQVLLTGLRHAHRVFYSTQAVREEILRHDLVPDRRLVQAPLGIAQEFIDVAAPVAFVPRYVLHVGSIIPRKNVDFLLQLFRALAERDPELRLLQIGGEWTPEQRRYLAEHRLEARVEQLRGISREELAHRYAGATLVLVPSLAEGFGLPVVEAVACGAPVVASDIPVLREVGIEGVHFCKPSDLAGWLATSSNVLANGPRIGTATRSRIHTRYSWRAHAQIIRDEYLRSAR